MDKMKEQSFWCWDHSFSWKTYCKSASQVSCEVQLGFKNIIFIYLNTKVTEGKGETDPQRGRDRKKFSNC